VSDISRWEREFVRYMDSAHPEVGVLLQKGAWNDEIESDLKQAIVDFNASWANS
jgi:hypothetical protein